MKKILYITLVSCIGLTIMISCSEKDESSSSSSFTEDISFDPSSVPDNGTTVVFGQSYQYQVTTDNNYSGTITYSLSNQPDGMTISSTGLIEWTPSKASEITTHSNITITLTTASGYVLTQTYDLTVTGTCDPGNVLSIWAGDQRSSTDSSKLLGNVTAYTDNSSSVKTASENYGLGNGSSVNLTHGPTPTATTGNVFFYNQYDNTTHLYLFYMFGVKGNSSADNIKVDIFTDNNSSTDTVVVADDSGEIGKQSSGCGSSDACYKARHSYNSANSDGGVIGPFSGSSYRILIDLKGFSTITPADNLTLGKLESFKFYSKDGSSFDLSDNESDWYPVDNFTVGYNTTLDCSN